MINNIEIKAFNGIKSMGMDFRTQAEIRKSRELLVTNLFNEIEECKKNISAKFNIPIQQIDCRPSMLTIEDSILTIGEYPSHIKFEFIQTEDSLQNLLPTDIQ